MRGRPFAHVPPAASLCRPFSRSVLNDSLEGYRVVLITEPKLPAWAKALGADPVQVHASVGNRQSVFVRSDR